MRRRRVCKSTFSTVTYPPPQNNVNQIIRPFAPPSHGVVCWRVYHQPLGGAALSGCGTIHGYGGVEHSFGYDFDDYEPHHHRHHHHKDYKKYRKEQKKRYKAYKKHQKKMAKAYKKHHKKHHHDDD